MFGRAPGRGEKLLDTALILIHSAQADCLLPVWCGKLTHIFDLLVDVPHEISDKDQQIGAGLK